MSDDQEMQNADSEQKMEVEENNKESPMADETNDHNSSSTNSDHNSNSNSDNDCVIVKSNDANTAAASSSSKPNGTSLANIGDPSTPKQSSASSKNATSNSRSKSKLTAEERAERAKKQAEEKEKRDKEKKEREEARLKREEEWRAKREEEAKRKAENAKKREEERVKREEDRLKMEEEKRVKAEKLAEEKERKRIELLEQERIKQEALLAKNEEKRKKDEEKRLLDAEKLKEEEEKRKKEEKIKSKFVGFFIKKENTTSDNKKDEISKTSRFMPFQPKENMKIAPICRRVDLASMSQGERQDFFCKFDEIIFTKNTDESVPNDVSVYLKEIKLKPFTRKKGDTKMKQSQNDEENSCDSSIKELDANGEEQTKFKVKYLHFNPKQHRRPPYYGTWRKKSAKIRPRAPFGKDDKFFDYEIDSDDEWESEPEGESINDSEKGSDDEEVKGGEAVEEEDEDSFLVPHGYLSDDELDEEIRELDPETKKARQDSKKEQWELDQKKKHAKVLVPKYFMAKNYWDCPEEHLKNNAVDLKFLDRFKMVSLVNTFPIVILDETANQLKHSLNEDSNSTPNSKTKNSKTNGATNQDGTTAATSSPSSIKPSKSKSKKSLVNGSSTPTITSATTIATPTPSTTTTNATAATTPTAKTPNIINFFSKMNNKKVTLSKVDTDKTDEIIVLDDKEKPASAPAMTITPQIVNTINAAASNATLSLHTNSVGPLSPKWTPTNNNTSNIAEKRVCSGNDETTVKRLRLDQDATSSSSSSSCQEVQTLTIVKKGGKKSLNFPSAINTEKKSDTVTSISSPTPLLQSSTAASSSPAQPNKKINSSFFDKLYAKKIVEKSADHDQSDPINSTNQIDNNKENKIAAVDLVTIE